MLQYVLVEKQHMAEGEAQEVQREDGADIKGGLGLICAIQQFAKPK